MNSVDPWRGAVPDPLDDWPDDARAASGASVTSPWRRVFDEINKTVDGRRDEVATVGSINWLRHAMELEGANPNVVRNIIYRDKGRLFDKRALFLVLQDLRHELGLAPIEDPALTYLGSPYAAAELEVAQVLGRQQRRVYRVMVGGVRAGSFPRLLVVGKPGSGKTMLADYIQRALAEDPQAAPQVVRFDFSESDLSSAFVRFGADLGLEPGLVESRLVRIGTASAFAVQADAQADVARAVLEGLRNDHGPRVLLLHLSHGLNRPGKLGAAPLRLNTPEVPRVTAAEWLWSTLIRQLATLPRTALYLSTAVAPSSALGSAGAAGWLDGPLKLAAPTVAEARNFVQAHAPQLAAAAHEEIVERAGRSYEALRTLSLLALLRRPPDHDAGDERALERLTTLVDHGAEAGLRAFLTALTVLSSGEPNSFDVGDLSALLATGKRKLSSVEQAFLDAVPGKPGHFRSFSRRYARALNRRLAANDPAALRRAHAAAAGLFRSQAATDPGSEAAQRFLHHALEAGEWEQIVDWLAAQPVSYASLERIWNVALAELADVTRFEDLAVEFARQLIRLGAHDHVEAVRAFERLAASERPAVRAWTTVMRAQAEVAAGRLERAEVLLAVSPLTDDPVLEAERDLTAASVLRWRGELPAAAALVAAAAGASALGKGQAAAALAAKTAVWSGLIAKDRGDLEAAIAALWTSSLDDDLVESRLAFQRGDVALQLGLFDTSRRELDRAVLAAERSEALPQERARFLARRGTLARLRGDLQGSSDYFSAAKSALAQSEADPVDAAFAGARIDDDASYTALAKGDFESAVVASTTAIATYREYQRRRDVDTTFRIARASLRLGVAYAFRGLAVPYRKPLAASLTASGRAPRADLLGPDIRHADESLATVLAQLTAPGSGLVSGSSAVRGLLREARLVSSYIAPDPLLALELAEAAAHDARFDYQRAEANTGRAHALMRLGRFDDALEALDTASDRLATARDVVASVVGVSDVEESGDLGLVAQIATYRATGQLAAGDQANAAETLCVALEDGRLTPFHEGLLRSFGEAAEAFGPVWRRHRRLRALLGMNGTGPSTPARLPDALVAAWRSRSPDSKAGGVA